MPKTRVQKETLLNKAEKNIAKGKSVVFIMFSGLSVAKLTELRRLMRKQEITFSVIKKTILRKALAANKLNIDDTKILEGKGAVAVAVGTGDEVAPAKIAYDFGKKEMAANKNLVFVLAGGVLNGDFLTNEAVNSLGKLPSREQLIAQVVYAVAAPLKSLLSGIVAVGDKKAEQK